MGNPDTNKAAHAHVLPFMAFYPMDILGCTCLLGILQVSNTRYGGAYHCFHLKRLEIKIKRLFSLTQESELGLLGSGKKLLLQIQHRCLLPKQKGQTGTHPQSVNTASFLVTETEEIWISQVQKNIRYQQMPPFYVSLCRIKVLVPTLFSLPALQAEKYKGVFVATPQAADHMTASYRWCKMSLNHAYCKMMVDITNTLISMPGTCQSEG